MPANVHVLRGNPSKLSSFDLGKDFQPEIEIPQCPQWLWPEAKKEWRRIAPELERYGLLSKLDRAALALYVQAWARYVWAEQQLAKAMADAAAARAKCEAAGVAYTGGDGIMVQTPNGGFTYSHYWVVSNRASQQVDQFLQSFGLSPSSRARVTVSENRQRSLFPEAGGEWDQM